MSDLTEDERSAIRDWIGGRDIVDLVHGLRCDAAELEAKLATVRRITGDAQARGGWVYWQALHLALEAKL